MSGEPFRSSAPPPSSPPFGARAGAGHASRPRDQVSPGRHAGAGVADGRAQPDGEGRDSLQQGPGRARRVVRQRAGQDALGRFVPVFDGGNTKAKADIWKDKAKFDKLAQEVQATSPSSSRPRIQATSRGFGPPSAPWQGVQQLPRRLPERIAATGRERAPSARSPLRMTGLRAGSPPTRSTRRARPAGLTRASTTTTRTPVRDAGGQLLHARHHRRDQVVAERHEVPDRREDVQAGQPSDDPPAAAVKPAERLGKVAAHELDQRALGADVVVREQPGPPARASRAAARSPSSRRSDCASREFRAAGGRSTDVADDGAGPRTNDAKRAFRLPTNPQITRNRTSASSVSPQRMCQTSASLPTSRS